MADFAYGFRQNTNYVITSNTMYEIGRNYRVNNSIPCQTSNTANYWTQVTNGYQYTIAIQSPGTLWSWGTNNNGVLGLNTSTVLFSSPIQVGTLSTWTQLASGWLHGVAIQSNGTLWAWGNNDYGQLGTSNTTSQSSPVQIGALTTWTKISCSYYSTAGIQSNGTLWAWGQNTTGQLGLSDTVTRYSPVQVGALSNWTNLSLFFNASYFVQSSGAAFATGLNANGQLGLSDTINRSSPVQIGALSTWSKIYGGWLSALGIQTNGTLWAWGSNTWGQLGLNTSTTGISSPAQVGALSNWSQVASGFGFTAALQSNGTLWSWGLNSQGQLGINTTTNYSSPVQVGTQSIWTQLVTNNSSLYVTTVPFMAGIQSPGTLWTWGSNVNFALGYNSTSYTSYPQQLGASNAWVGFPTGSQNNIWGAAINSNNNLYVWGVNSNRILNSNYYNNDNAGVTINGAAVIVTPVPLDPTLSTPIKSVSIGDQFGVYVQSNGTLWSWGNLSYGQTTAPYPTSYMLVPARTYMSNWASLGQPPLGSYSSSIQSNGTLWTWGLNSSGQLGQGNTTNYSSPVQVGASSTWTQVAGGLTFQLAIQSPGTLWSWGAGANGQLGQSNTTNYSSPVQVGALSAWTQISAGAQHSTAIQSPGTLWSWGNNAFGQLGLNTTTGTSSPIQVFVPAVWKTIGKTFAFSQIAIQSNGTLWAWGNNAYGQLGTSNTTNYSSPVQVGTLSVWTQIACGYYHSMAVQSNGTLWAWGYNGYGELGTSNTSWQSSPVQVGALSIWTKVAGGGIHSLAIQSNGTLWAWGSNSFGQLGVNTSLGYQPNSPVQVGTLSVWTQIACGYYSTAGIQSNGTLWTWGINNLGQLGQGNTTNYSSPVQVGTLSTWSQVSVGWSQGASGSNAGDRKSTRLNSSHRL